MNHGATSVGHVDPGTQASLAAYTRRLSDGASVLVRPTSGYDGLDRVVEHLRSWVVDDLLLTDLAGHDEVVAGAGADALVALHTSGSTGSPKCVVYTAEVARAHAAMVAEVLALDPERSYLALPPPRFAYGISIVTSHHLAGVPVTFAPVTSLESAVADVAPEVVYLLPQQVPALIAAADHLAGVRQVVVAGGRLTAGAVSALRERLGDIGLVNMYGQAELGPRLATWSGALSEFVEGCVGEPVPGVRLEAETDENGRSRLLARSAYAAHRVLAAPYDEPQVPHGRDTVVATGDLGRRTPAGWRHDGRADRFANVAGTRLDLGELELRVQELIPVTALRVGTRRSRVSGDEILEVQVVPAPGTTLQAGDVRRALHPVLGAIVALADVSVVEHLRVGEAGK